MTKTVFFMDLTRERQRGETSVRNVAMPAPVYSIRLLLLYKKANRAKSEGEKVRKT